MKSRSQLLQRAMCVLIAACALIAMVILSREAKWPYPPGWFEKGTALAVATTGTIAAYLACVLSIVLCWKESQNRAARYLSAFLVFLVLSAGLYTRSPASILPSESTVVRFTSVIALACSVAAGFAWIRFCRAFPREFSSRELPSFYPSGEVLGLFAPQRSPIPTAQYPGGMKRMLLQSRFFGRAPDRYIDSEKAEFILLVTGLLYTAFSALASIAPPSASDRERFLPTYFIALTLGLGTDMLRQRYYLSGEAERRKILWVAEGTVLGFALIPFAGFVIGVLLSPWSESVPWVFALGCTIGALWFVICAIIGIFKEGAIDPGLVIKKTALSFMRCSNSTAVIFTMTLRW
jgi:hypothetical protein